MLKLNKEYVGRLVSHKGKDWILSDVEDQKELFIALYNEGLKKLFHPDSVKAHEESLEKKNPNAEVGGNDAQPSGTAGTAGATGENQGTKPAK